MVKMDDRGIGRRYGLLEKKELSAPLNGSVKRRKKWD